MVRVAYAATPRARSKTKRSAELWLMSRSCHSAMLSRPTSASRAQEPGHAAHPLGEDGVALVGHRARSLLPRPERLERLAHLGALKVPDLDRDALQRPAEDGERRQQLGVTVAAHDLGRGRVDGEADRVEDMALDRLAHVRMRADRPRDRADRDLLARPLEAERVAPELGVPAGGLEPERDRLGVDAVAAPDHRRGPMLEGEPPHHLDEPRQLALDDAGRVPQHDRGGGVEDVGAGEAVMEPAALRSQALGHRAQEGDDVVLRLALDLARALGVHVGGGLAYAVPVRLGHDPLGGQGLDGEELDPQPELELAPLSEDLAQLGQRVAVDHVRPGGRLAARLRRPARRGRRRPAARPRDRPAPGCERRDGRRSSRRRSRWRPTRPARRAASGRPSTARPRRRERRHRAESRSPAGSSGWPARPGRCAASPAAPTNRRTPAASASST